MNKIFAIVLISLLPICFAGECANIPSFTKLKTWASTLNNQALNDQIAIFESATPTVTQGLGFCGAQFDNNTSCCTHDFIEVAKKAIEVKTERLQQKKPIYGHILGMLTLSIDKCVNSTVKAKLPPKKNNTTNQGDPLNQPKQPKPNNQTNQLPPPNGDNQSNQLPPPPPNQQNQTNPLPPPPAGKGQAATQEPQTVPNQQQGPEQGQPEGNLPQIDKSFTDQYKRCQAMVIVASRKFQRGAFCSLCINPAKISDYFLDDGTLKVDQSALDTYTAEMNAAFQCIGDLKAAFQAKVDELMALIDGSQCPNVKQRVQAVVDSVATCTGTDCGSLWTTKIKLFGEDVESTAVPDASSIQDINEGQGTTSNLLRRFLASNYGEVIGVTNGGVKVFIADASDSQITVDGVTADPIVTSSNSQTLIIFTLFWLSCIFFFII